MNGTDMLKHADDDEHYLTLVDDTHQATTLTNLNKMRKNRHFCDVILQVCALTVQHAILRVSVKRKLLKMYLLKGIDVV